jgi:predicted phosphodiesterase
MKIAFFSDIHANLPALEAVLAHLDAWGPDQIVMGGDLVNRGPRPRECLELVQRRVAHDGNWTLIQGNHEGYVIHQARPDAPRRGPAYEVHRPSFWTLERLGGDVAALRAMPAAADLASPAGIARFTHGSPLGQRDGVYPHTTDAELHTKLAAAGLPLPAVFGVGHTHWPLLRRLEETLVVNAGSAGLPFDGDIRPSYAQITLDAAEAQAEIVRFDYDFARAQADFLTTGYLAEGGPLIRLVQRELERAESLLFDWAWRYQQPVLDGEISLDASVDAILQREAP